MLPFSLAYGWASHRSPSLPRKQEEGLAFLYPPLRAPARRAGLRSPLGRTGCVGLLPWTGRTRTLCSQHCASAPPHPPFLFSRDRPPKFRFLSGLPQLGRQPLTLLRSGFFYSSLTQSSTVQALVTNRVCAFYFQINCPEKKPL